MDPVFVAGLDVAIYRDTAGRFEFADSDPLWERAGCLDRELAQLIKTKSIKSEPRRPLRFSRLRSKITSL